MKIKILKKLIDVYANNSVEDIDSDGDPILKAFNITNLEELTEIEGYDEAVEFIKTIKKKLEIVETKAGDEIKFDTKIQVIESLKWILYEAFFSQDDQARYELKLDTMKELILSKYSDNWNVNEKNHFNFLYPKIKDWNICFFSYTRKGAHLINNEYKKCLKIILKEAGLNLKAKDWKESNLVARAMIQILKRQNIKKVFFDEKNLNIGDELYKKIKNQLSQSFIFIQLVALDTFIEDEQNWPFKEYTDFTTSNLELMKKYPTYNDILSNRIIFSICEKKLEDIRPVLFPPQYEEWYDNIGKNLYKYIAEKDSNQFLENIKEIAVSILRFFEEKLIPSIPS